MAPTAFYGPSASATYTVQNEPYRTAGMNGTGPAAGNTPTTLSTQGMVGQYPPLLGGQLSLQGGGTQTALQLGNQTTNSILSSQNAPFNPLQLSSYESWLSGIPSKIGSTFGGLLNYLITPPG